MSKTVSSRNYIILGLGAALATGFYLAISGLQTPIGFPLDDAWIHQVFARNLALSGQFAYNPGQVVAGSTSPVWSVLLAPAYWFGSDFYKLWTFTLGTIFLALTAVEVYRLSFLLFQPIHASKGLQHREAWCAAGFTLLEWHLLWATTSGMETMLFTFISLWLVRLWLETEHRENNVTKFSILFPYFVLGLVGGLLMLVRVEGLFLLGLIALEIGRGCLFTPKSASATLETSRTANESPKSFIRKSGLIMLGRKWLALVGGWLLLTVPYLIFNYSSSGSPLPTTFYAKVSAYAPAISLWNTLRFLQEALQEIIGHSPLLFLVALVIIYLFVLIIRPKVRAEMGYVDWRVILWPIMLLLIYGYRLPVTYQHARYLMPLFPFLILYSIWAVSRLKDYLQTTNLPKLALIMPIVIGLVAVVTCYTGAITYEKDVEFFNDVQVQIGQWLHDHTTSDSLIATHDIGAIAYFSGRRVIDTAGLINPEFIPIEHNEAAILQKLQADGANYFALVSDWNPELYQKFTNQNLQVFQPSQDYLSNYGLGRIMHVFKLR